MQFKKDQGHWDLTVTDQELHALIVLVTSADLGDIQDADVKKSLHSLRQSFADPQMAPRHRCLAYHEHHTFPYWSRCVFNADDHSEHLDRHGQTWIDVVPQGPYAQAL